MTRPTVVLAAALIAVAATHLSTGASAQADASRQQFPQELIARIDAVVKEEMRVSRIPGAAVAVVENGKIVLQRAYGFANLETETPLTTDGIFEIASITKQFTAAAIMMLVEEGKLKLDDLVTTYIEGAPPAWQAITIRHLLTHTSGLAIAALPRPGGSAPMNVTTKQAFEFIAQQPLQFPTGRAGFYSDAGYVLLGMVIEKASGQSYRDFVTKRVFEPLKMKDSSLRDKRRVLKRRVALYSTRNGEIVNWGRDSDFEMTSAFGIHSTLADLAAWDASLRRATLLKAASLEQIWTPAKFENGQLVNVMDHLYGFGWELADARGHATVGHGGASGTYILRFVDEPLSIVVLTNLDTESGRHPKFLARALAGAVRPQYQPPHMLTPQVDYNSKITETIQQLLTDIAARRPSTVMSDAYAEWYKSSPGARAWMASQLAGATKLNFLARDDLRNRSLWGGEPLQHLVHYTTETKGRTTWISAGITRDGKIAMLDYYWR